MNLRSDTISIVTPSFNQAAFIGATIESVISQEGDFYVDYIIKDGKSVDNSVEIIKEYEQLLKANCTVELIDGIAFYKAKDDFKFCKCNGVSFRWVSEKDKGHADALNWGFKQSFGEIMGWINSDDLYHPGAFQKLFDAFSNNPKISWVMGRNTWWDRDGTEIADFLMLKNKWDFLRGNYGWIQQESTFWRRTLWNETSSYINTDYRFMVDNDLWARFFLKEKLYTIDAKLGGYRVWGENRAKKNTDAVLAEMGTIVKNMRSKISFREKIALIILKVSVVLQRAIGRFNLSKSFISKLYPYYLINSSNQIVKIDYDISEKLNNEVSQIYQLVDNAA